MEEQITFGNRAGERLAGVLHRPRTEGAAGGVLLCHGMESSKESLKLVHLGEVLSRAGFAVLRFDFTGAEARAEALRRTEEWIIRHLRGTGA